MIKKRWMLMMVATLVAVSVSAQFPGGFPGQFGRRQAQQKAEQAEKNYQKGNELLEAKKYDKAFEAYEKAANDGHAGAQYNLGTFYIEGKVVPQDYNKAVEWFEKAAKQGLKDAQYNLAAMYHQGAGVPKDEEKAEYWAKVYKDVIKLEKPKEEFPAFPFPFQPQNTDPVEQEPDEEAQFPGGQRALMTWLGQNMKYPSEAMEEGIDGRVMVGFVINKDGSVDEVKVVKSVHPILDAEAVRVIKSMPKWTPGKKAGKAVRVGYTLPLTFRLNPAEEPAKTEKTE